MNLPGFHAESSLGPALGAYRGQAINLKTHGSLVTRLGAVTPAQLTGRFGVLVPDCFGSTENCIDNFCSTLEGGPEKAKCFAACEKPSVCGGCDCTCSPNCARTCRRTCTKRTPSYVVTCRGSCFPGEVANPG